MYTLGNNSFGQCGRPIIPNENYKASRTIHVIDRDDITKAVCGHDHTILLSDVGKVFTCGLGTDGQTGMQYAIVQSSEQHWLLFMLRGIQLMIVFKLKVSKLLFIEVSLYIADCFTITRFFSEYYARAW